MATVHRLARRLQKHLENKNFGLGLNCAKSLNQRAAPLFTKTWAQFAPSYAEGAKYIECGTAAQAEKAVDEARELYEAQVAMKAEEAEKERLAALEKAENLETVE